MRIDKNDSKALLETLLRAPSKDISTIMAQGRINRLRKFVTGQQASVIVIDSKEKLLLKPKVPLIRNVIPHSLFGSSTEEFRRELDVAKQAGNHQAQKLWDQNWGLVVRRP